MKLLAIVALTTTVSMVSACLITNIANSNNNDTATQRLVVTLELHRTNHTIINAEFAFYPNDIMVEQRLNDFCNANEMELEACENLHQAVLDLRYKHLEKNMIYTQLAKLLQNDSNVDLLTVHYIPNPHLKRVAVARAAEINNHFKNPNKSERMIDAIEGVVHTIQSHIISGLLDEPREIDQHSLFHQHDMQLAFIHSCTLPGENNRVLSSLLDSIFDSGLVSRLKYLFVLNYGLIIEESFKLNYLNQMSYKIVFIHVSDDLSYFEVPTINSIYYVSFWLRQNLKVDMHLLYLHTKGVSYKETYMQIEDWRNFMLYFLVEKHITCYHILARYALCD